MRETHLLFDRLTSAYRVAVQAHAIGYTLVRAGTGAECYRLGYSPDTRRWWAACLRLALSDGVPVFCLDPRSGDGVPHNVSCLGFCRSSPKCSDVPLQSGAAPRRARETWPAL